MNVTQRASYLRGLADETRLEIFGLLAKHKELSVTELTVLLGLPQPTVSKHLRAMKLSEIVAVRRLGVKRLYSLDKANVVELNKYSRTMQLEVSAP